MAGARFPAPRLVAADPEGARCDVPALLLTMRWNLAADHGVWLADRILDAYRAISGRALAHRPYWDLVTLLDLVLSVDPAVPFLTDVLAPLEAHAAVILGRLWTHDSHGVRRGCRGFRDARDDGAQPSASTLTRGARA